MRDRRLAAASRPPASLAASRDCSAGSTRASEVRSWIDRSLGYLCEQVWKGTKARTQTRN